MNNHPPYLEKYKGIRSRHECPACHDKSSFARYLNGDTSEVINQNVGRCNREDKCGYHLTPKQYFEDHPEPQDYNKGNELFSTVKKGEIGAKSNGKVTVRENMENDRKTAQNEQEPGRIPKQYIIQSLGYNSNFVAFLCSIFDRYTLEAPTIQRLMADYYLGQTKDKSLIFWQIDGSKRIRTGKIMQYNPETGKRIKNATGAIDWVHSKLKRGKVLPDDFNLVQCLFGEHLLRRYPDKIVALVESEKSALIAAGVYPEYIWLATGGRSQLSIDKLRVLRGRTVIMFPDTDTDGKTYALWSEKAGELQAMGCTATVSDLLERIATDTDRANGLDIADYLIRELKASVPDIGNPITENPAAGIPIAEPACSLTTEERALQYLGNLNPNVYALIDALELVSASTGERLRTQVN